MFYGLVSLFVQLESTFDRRLQETLFIIGMSCKMENIVKLRQGSGKDRQGMAVKAKGLKA